MTSESTSNPCTHIPNIMVTPELLCFVSRSGSGWFGRNGNEYLNSDLKGQTVGSYRK